MKKLFVLSLLFVAPLALADQPANLPVQSRLGAGYLQGGAMPDALMLLKAPPIEGSWALAHDRRSEANALKLHGTPRWDQAIIDADLFTPKATDSFSCAAGFVISKETTPKIDALMRKTAPDFGLSTYPAKNKYKRERPFVGNGKPMCSPELDATLRKDGSYPSGHAAIGFGWGQLLGEIVPKRKKQLLVRGQRFADSRRICNVHFASDIQGGAVMANAVFKALKADPVFQTDLAAAQAEAKALVPIKPDCTREKAAFE
jgi:acid phosphatase (class A)